MRCLGRLTWSLVPTPSPIATALLSALTRGGRSAGPAYRVRKLLGRRNLVAEATIGGRRILVPLGHDLPVILATHPNYAGNLVRLAVAAGGPVVDIGANVGDTAILIRERSSLPILAIEGDSAYLPLLQANVAEVTDVEVEASYVASDLYAAGVKAQRTVGTAALIPSTAGEPVPMRSLVDIVEDHPRFAAARLVKLDTDGADAAIVVENAGWLGKARPVVFLEYDAQWAARLGDPEPWRAFTALAEVGYGRAVAYVNTGELLLTGHAGDTHLWRDLAGYMTGHGRQHYLDVAVFHDEDAQLADTFIERERAIMTSGTGKSSSVSGAESRP